MATLGIRNLDERARRTLRERAARSGVSMEQAARDRLTRSAFTPRRTKATIDDILALGIAPVEPFDLKKVRDEMWDEGLR
jgi:plasmid stability protein